MLPGQSHPRRHQWLILAILFVLALAVRSFRAQQEVIANPDVMRYIDQAQALAMAPISTLRAEVYHPLHAALGLFVHTLIGPRFANERWSWLWSLRIVGIVAGSIVAVQIALLSRYFGAPLWAGVGAGMVWIVGRRTSVYGADGLSDMVALALFAGAMLTALPALRFRPSRTHPNPLLRRTQTLRFFAAGVLSGLAYLARPEGLAAALIVALTLLVLALCRQRRATAGRRFKILPRFRVPAPMAAAAIACLLAGFLIPALPYMLAIGGLTGKKTLTVERAPLPGEPEVLLAGVAPVIAQTSTAPLPHAWPFIPAPVQKVTIELFETFFWAPWAVLLLAVPLLPRSGAAGLRPLVLVWIAVWDAVMYWLLRHSGYLDGRHTLPLQLVLHGLFALALVAWMKPMVWWIRRWRKDPQRWAALPAWRRWKNWPQAFAAGVCGLAMLPGIIELARPPRLDKANLREAAAYIQKSLPANVVVCDFERLVGFYSMHPYAQWFGSVSDPQLEAIDAIRRSHGNGPAVLGKVYLLGKGNLPATAIGPYREIRRFESPVATQDDVYVLYALPAEPPGPTTAEKP